MGRIKGLLVVLLSGVFWIGAYTNASAATIDLDAEGLVANPMGAFFTGSGADTSFFDGTDYSYLGFDDPAVGISSMGTGSMDFTLTLNGGLSGNLLAASEIVMDSATSIDILFEIISNSFIDISGSHVLASITHADDLAPAGSDIFSRSISTDSFASIALTSVAPIPLPAGMLLLLSALGGFILVRLRRSA